MLLTILLALYGVIAILITILYLVALFTDPDRTISGFKAVLASCFCGAMWLPVIIYVFGSVYFEDRF